MTMNKQAINPGHGCAVLQNLEHYGFEADLLLE